MRKHLGHALIAAAEQVFFALSGTPGRGTYTPSCGMATLQKIIAKYDHQNGPNARLMNANFS